MTREMDLLLNAFRPATEMDEPSLFTGRAEELRSLAEALHVAGVAPVVYGDRGLGKSSLALQIRRIAMGDTELLDDYDLGSYAFGIDDSWLVFYVLCTSETPTVPDVIQRPINSVTSATLESVDRDSDHLVDRTTTFKVSLKMFERETSRRYETRIEDSAYKNLGLEERLLDACNALFVETGHRVLLVVDELDRLRDPSGLASLVKTASSDHLKFLLVGIAQNLSDLIDDHQSVERLLAPVRVPPMPQEDLASIIDRALDQLGEAKFGFEFAPDTRRRIADIASGFPWFVHVLGQSSLVLAYDSGNRVVTQEHLAAALHSLTNNRFAQQFSDLYQTAVRDSPRRELVLKAFARWKGRDIPTGAVYPLLKGIGVTAPSVYKGHLTSAAYGRVLLIPPFQVRGMVRFANEMFKVYARLRMPIFAKTNELLDAAFDAAYPPKT